MATASTIYDVNVRYMMEDRTSRKAQALTKVLHSTAKQSNLLRRSLVGIGAAAATFFGFRAAKEALIGFNADMEQAKNTMAGMLQLNIGGEFSDNIARANVLVADLQQRAKVSVGTTKDFVNVASLLVRPFAAANVPVERMGKLVQGVVVATKAFGIQADVAARDVEAALMGNVRAVDRFARSLGIVPAEFNKLSKEARRMQLEKLLTQPAIEDMARAQEKSFDGVISTFQDNLQIAIGKVGLPLFQAITAEVKRWNMWLDQNADLVARIGKDFGGMLVSGFETIKEVISFFVENRDTLMLLAKMWIGAKLIGGGLTAISSGMGAFGGMMAGFKETAKTLRGGGGVVAGMRGLSASIGPLAIAVGLAAGAVKHFMDNLLRDKDEQNRLTSDFGTIGFMAFRNVSRADVTGDEKSARGTVNQLRQLGLITQGGSLRGNAMFRQLKQITDETRATLSRQIGVRLDPGASPGVQAGLLAEAFRESFKRVVRNFGPDILKEQQPVDAAAAAAAAATGGIGKGQINVTIAKIEVVSDDPDRFVDGFTNAMADLARNPNSAINTLEER